MILWPVSACFEIDDAGISVGVPDRDIRLTLSGRCSGRFLPDWKEGPPGTLELIQTRTSSQPVTLEHDGRQWAKVGEVSAGFADTGEIRDIGGGIKLETLQFNACASMLMDQWDRRTHRVIAGIEILGIDQRPDPDQHAWPRSTPVLPVTEFTLSLVPLAWKAVKQQSREVMRPSAAFGPLVNNWLATELGADWTSRPLTRFEALLVAAVNSNAANAEYGSQSEEDLGIWLGRVLEVSRLCYEALDSKIDASNDESWRNIWQHVSRVPVVVRQGDESRPLADTETLEYAVAKYLNDAPLSIGFMEWMLLDAIVFEEIARFARPVYFHNSLSFRDCIVFGIGLSARAQDVRLLQQMMKAYLSLSPGPVMNPSLVRDELLGATKAGAVWPPSVYALIGHVVDRDPSVWITMPL